MRGRLRLDLEVVDIHHTIRQAVEICRNDALVSGVGVMTELNAESHHVIADHARLMQIIWNLIRNALKFTPSRGQLTISSHCTPVPTATTTDNPAQLAPSHVIFIEFRDTGIGIEPSLLGGIFNAFEQSRDDLRSRSSGGLGLGLAISKSLAEALGGRLSATSAGPGLGSTFRLELTTVSKPARPRDSTSDRPDPPHEIDTASRPLRIILLEDNDDTRHFLAIVLRQHGHDVTTAECLAQAHSIIASAQMPFDLLISDIELPDGSGLHLMCDLGRGQHLPGIAMSGFGTEEDVKLSREAGFFEHLTKPIDINRLEAAIQRAAHIMPDQHTHQPPKINNAAMTLQ
jgi:CheY-like chemotaxis protein